MSNPSYSKEVQLSIGDLIQRLSTFVADTDHEFWPDDLSFRRGDLFIREKLHGSARLTDVYLLGLATKRKGRLATFDEGITIAAVKNAKPHNLVHI